MSAVTLVWLGWGFSSGGAYAQQANLNTQTQRTEEGIAISTTEELEPGAELRIRGFTVIGSNPLSDAEITLALAPFLRKPATLDNLQAATSAVEALLERKGYGLYRVLLPPQEVGDTIQLQLAKFTIGKVTVEGAQTFSADNIRRSLPELQEDNTPNLPALTAQTAFANEHPSKKVQLSLREGDASDQIDVTLKVQETSPFALTGTLTNSGSASSGRDRFTLTAAHSNLWGLDHQAQASYTTSLERSGDVRQFGLNYRVPFYGLSSTLDLSHTRSNVIGNFSTFTSSGAGRTWGALYTWHLPAEKDTSSHRFTFQLEDKVFDATEINGAVLPGQVARRTRPLSLGHNVRVLGETSQFDWNTSLTANLSGGVGNTLAAYQSESPAVTRRNWTALRTQSSYVQTLAKDWLLSWRTQSQWTSTALIAGEQIGLGGMNSLRGAAERALSGDQGILSTVEVTTPEMMGGLRWVGFWDAGWLRSRREATSTLPRSDSAASIGLGLRYIQGPWSLALDAGRIVKSSRIPPSINSSAPQSGDYKFHLLLTGRY
jgi:hemolysin activation/secretion protein